MIQPSSWELLGFKHRYLPVADYSLASNHQLIIEALAKMKEAVDQGQSIYIHCKAGAGRSPFIAALFYCIMNYDIMNASDLQLESFITASIANVKKARPLITNLSRNIPYALDVIKGYREQQPKMSQADDPSIEFIAKLVQSYEFKAFILFAYQNEKYFKSIKKILKKIYKDPSLFLATLNEQINAIEELEKKGVYETAESKKAKDKPPIPSLNKAITTLCKDKKAKRVLLNLKAYLEAETKPKNLLQQQFEQLQQILNKPPYSNSENSEIKANVYRLMNEIWLTNAPIDKKKKWLSTIINFLNNPIENAENYIKDSIDATYASAKIGKLMILISLSVLAIAISLAFVFPIIIPALTCLTLISPVVIFGGIHMICSAPKDIQLAQEKPAFDETPIEETPDLPPLPVGP